MADIKIKITKAQREVILAHVNGSESLDAAIAAGLAWTQTTLTIPGAAWSSFGYFIGMRADIARDCIAYAQPGETLPSERAEFRATLNLAAKVASAMGVQAL